LIVATTQTIGVALVRPEGGEIPHHLAQFVANPLGISFQFRRRAKLSRVKNGMAAKPGK